MVPIIIPTILLIKDKYRGFRQKNVNSFVLIATIIKAYPNI